MSCKSGKRLARPRDSARGPHAYQHDRAVLKHHKGPASKVAQSPRAGWHERATPTSGARSPHVHWHGRVTPVPSRLKHFSGIPSWLSENTFPKTFLGFC